MNDYYTAYKQGEQVANLVLALERYRHEPTEQTANDARRCWLHTETYLGRRIESSCGVKRGELISE